MRTSPRHPMQRLNPAGMPEPDAQSLMLITEQMRRDFTSCPHISLMRGALTKLKKQARDLGGDQVVHHFELSPFTGADLGLGLSYGHDPDVANILGTARRWHLSISQRLGDHREPAPLPELLGWVMAGWSTADRFVTFTVNGGLAIHADVPVSTEKDVRAFWASNAPSTARPWPVRSHRPPKRSGVEPQGGERT